MVSRLFNATKKQREAFEIGHFGLHWEEIDEDISIAGLLAERCDQTTDARSAVRFKIITASGRRQRVIAFPELEASVDISHLRWKAGDGI